MKIKYLGTAAVEGWPNVFCNCPFCKAARELGGKNIRTRSQALVDTELLLDFPCDTYLHVLRENLNISAVRWLLITHSHTDHIYPAELVNRGGCYSHDMDSPILNIFCNETVKNYIFTAAGHEMEPDVRNRLKFCIVQPFQPFEAGPYRITPLPAKHMQTEQALFYLIERDGHSLLYAHDTGRFYPEVYEFLGRRKTALDMVSLDCTSGRYENGDNDGHMGFPDTIIVKNKLMEIEAADGHTQFVLNHFSHNGQWLYDEIFIRSAVENMKPSYDGMTVEF